MTCECLKCRAEAKIEAQQAIGDGRSKADWQGTGITEVIIAGPGGAPMVVATIQINVVPLIVEPWMVTRVLRVAGKILSKCVANYGVGKELN